MIQKIPALSEVYILYMGGAVGATQICGLPVGELQIAAYDPGSDLKPNGGGEGASSLHMLLQLEFPHRFLMVRPLVLAFSLSATTISFERPNLVIYDPSLLRLLAFVHLVFVRFPLFGLFFFFFFFGLGAELVAAAVAFLTE